MGWDVGGGSDATIHGCMHPSPLSLFSQNTALLFSTPKPIYELPQTEIIPEEIARLPLPPGTSYRCLAVEDDHDDFDDAHDPLLPHGMQVSISSSSLSALCRQSSSVSVKEKEMGEGVVVLGQSEEGEEQDYRMVRTATNTISAETPCHKHHHHHHHKGGGKQNRGFNDFFSPQEAEAAALDLAVASMEGGGAR